MRFTIFTLALCCLFASDPFANAGKRAKALSANPQAGRQSGIPARQHSAQRQRIVQVPTQSRNGYHRKYAGVDRDCYRPAYRRNFGSYSNYYVDQRYSSFGYGYIGYVYQPVVVPAQFQVQYVPSYPSGYAVAGQSIPTSLVPQYQVLQPNTGQAHPAFNNEVIRGTLKENDLRWLQPLQVEPVQTKSPKEIPSSTAEGKLASMRDQANGDMWFRKQKFQLADQRYRAAINHARDRAEPHFRLALAKAHTGLYASAVRSLRQGLQWDPSWPTTGQTFESLYTEELKIAKTVLLQKVADWVRQDIRDPDRLFLLGVLMHFDSDKRSQEVFELAYRLAGRGDHLSLFLKPVAVVDTKEPTKSNKPPVGDKPVEQLIPPLPVPPLPAPPQPLKQQSQPEGPVLQPGEDT